MAVVGSLDHILLDYRAGKTRPATPGVIFVDRGEQWFSRDHVDVDAWSLVVDILAGERHFGAALLCHSVLLRRQPAEAFIGLRVFSSRTLDRGDQRGP